MRETVYRAPKAFVALFYTLLAAWTVVFVPLAISRVSRVSTGLLLMIAFFALYSWYWSLGIAYMIKAGDDGTIHFVSVRAHTQAHHREIEQVEGPSLPIRFGFVKFRREGERTYAFFEENEALRRILADMRASNPNIRFRGLPQRMFQPT